jgi:hypothetical protein
MRALLSVAVLALATTTAGAVERDAEEGLYERSN